MKKINDDVMETWLELRKMLGNGRDFSDMLLRQLKDYEITPAFIWRFEGIIDVSKLSGLSLSAECIECLDELGKFDAGAWKESAESKDLGILLNKDLSEKYKLDADELLGKAKFVSDDVFDGLLGSVSRETAAHMVRAYRGDHCALDTAIEYLDELGGAVVAVKCVRQDLASDDSKFLGKIIQSGKALDPLVAIGVMHAAYAPAECADLTLKDADEKALNGMDLGTADRYREMLDDIVQRYSTDAASSIMVNLSMHASPIITDRKLIRDWLIFCDGIAEQDLLSMAPIACRVGLRDEVVAYAKNYGYKDLLIAINLGN